MRRSTILAADFILLFSLPAVSEHAEEFSVQIISKTSFYGVTAINVQ